MINWEYTPGNSHSEIWEENIPLVDTPTNFKLNITAGQKRKMYLPIFLRDYPYWDIYSKLTPQRIICLEFSKEPLKRKICKDREQRYLIIPKKIVYLPQEICTAELTRASIEPLIYLIK